MQCFRPVPPSTQEPMVQLSLVQSASVAHSLLQEALPMKVPMQTPCEMSQEDSQQKGSGEAGHGTATERHAAAVELQYASRHWLAAAQSRGSGAQTLAEASRVLTVQKSEPWSHDEGGRQYAHSQRPPHCVGSQ